MTQGSVRDTTGYVNYVYNISARGTTQVASQLMGLSNVTGSILGQLAFQTSSYLSSTEGALLSMGIVATAGFSKATQKASEFDQALSTIGAISGKTRSEVSGLGDQAIAMSNKFGMAVGEMTTGLEALARAGVSTGNMNAILEQAMGLSKLEGLSLETAINSLISTTNLLDTTGLDLESPEYAEAVRRQNQRITATSEAAPINAQDIIHTLEHVGGYASSTNLDQDDLFAVIAQLGSKGTKSEMAGTSLRAFLAAGQKDTAQRALKRIGLEVSDLWKNDDTIMSITDMKDVLDQAMEAKGYTRQEKLEFYSDFAGYKQANQIMKIDTNSAREFKDKIDRSWDMGKKIGQVIGTAETHLQGLVQAGTNLLIKVGEPFLPIISTIAWTLKTGIDIINMIPGSNLVIAGGLILTSVKAISTIFNKIVPQLAASKGNLGGISSFLTSIREDLHESFIYIKNINNTDFMKQKSREIEANRIDERDKYAFWESKTGKRINSMADVWRLERQNDFQDDKQYIEWKKAEAKKPLKKSKEPRNQRQQSQTKSKKTTTESSNNREQNKKINCCDLIVQAIENSSEAITSILGTISGKIDDIYTTLQQPRPIDNSIIDNLKNHTFKVSVVNISDRSFSTDNSSNKASNSALKNVETSKTQRDRSTTQNISQSNVNTSTQKKSSTRLLTNGVLDQKKIDKFIDDLEINFGFDLSTSEGRISQDFMLNYAKDVLKDNFRNNRNKLTGQSEEVLKKRIENELKDSILKFDEQKLGSILATKNSTKNYSSKEIANLTSQPNIYYNEALKSADPKLAAIGLDYTKVVKKDNKILKGGGSYLKALAHLSGISLKGVNMGSEKYRSQIADTIAENFDNAEKLKEIQKSKDALDKVFTNKIAYYYIHDLGVKQQKEFMEKVGLEKTSNPYVDMVNYIKKAREIAPKGVGKGVSITDDDLNLVKTLGGITEFDKDKLKVTEGFSAYRNDLRSGVNVKNEISSSTEKAIKMLGEEGYLGVANHLKKITDAIVELAIQEDIKIIKKEMEEELGEKISISDVIRNVPSLAQPHRFKFKINDYDDIGKISPDNLDLASTIWEGLQQAHDDNIGGNEKFKNRTKGSEFGQLERTKLVHADKKETYFEKEMEELSKLSFQQLLRLIYPPDIVTAMQDYGPHQVGGNNTGIKNVGVSELEALPFTFEGHQIKGIFKRLPTHGRDMLNTAIVSHPPIGNFTYLGQNIIPPEFQNGQLQGYLRNDKGRYHEAYSWALEQKRNRETMQRNQKKAFAYLGLTSGLSRQDIMDMPMTQSQKDKVEELYKSQKFVNIEQYKKHYQDLYDAATPEQRKNMMTGDEALLQLRGQMAAARKVELGENGEVIDNGSMFEIQVTPEEYRRRLKAGLIYAYEGEGGILKRTKNKKGQEFYTINDFESLHYSYNDIKRRVLLEDVMRAQYLQNKNSFFGDEVENLSSWFDVDTSLNPNAETNNLFGVDFEVMNTLNSILTSKIDSDIQDLSQYDIVKELSSDDIAEKILEVPENQINSIMYALFLFNEDLYKKVIGSFGKLYSEEESTLQKIETEKEKVISEIERFDQALDIIYNIVPEFIDSLSSQEKHMYMNMVKGAENPVADLLSIAQVKGYNLEGNLADYGRDYDLVEDFVDAMNINIGEKTHTIADEIDEEIKEAILATTDPAYDTRALVSSVGTKDTERIDKIKKALQTNLDNTQIENFKAINEYFNPTQQHFESDIIGGTLSTQALNIISQIQNGNLVWKETTPGGNEEPTILGEEENTILSMPGGYYGQVQLPTYNEFKRNQTKNKVEDKVNSIKELVSNGISIGIDTIYNKVGMHDNSNIKVFNNMFDSVENVNLKLQGFTNFLQEASDKFSFLIPIVIALEGVLSTLSITLETLSGIKEMINLKSTMNAYKGDTFQLFGSKFEKDSNSAKILLSISSVLGTVIETITSFVSAFYAPLLLLAGAFVTTKVALDWSYKSHQKYIKQLQDEEKANKSKSKSLQLATEQSKKTYMKNRNEQKDEVLERKYLLNKQKLDSANLRRTTGAINLTNADNDMLWGKYGITSALDKIQGKYESTAADYDGTTGQLRRIKEHTTGGQSFMRGMPGYYSPAEERVSAYYDANKLAFGMIDEYKDELGELYDTETKAMKKNPENPRETMMFQKALDKFVEATGITKEHAQQYLDYMQTEHNVDNATQAMQAQADMISAKTEMQIQAISFGGNPADVLGLNGIEAQQNAMVQAQADMIKLELSSQLWWKAVWSTITSPVRAIISPIFAIAHTLAAIWSVITGNWDNAGMHMQQAGASLNVLGETTTYWGAWATAEGTDFSGIGQNAIDETDRANYGNAPATGGGGGTHVPNPESNAIFGFRPVGGGKKGPHGVKEHKAQTAQNAQQSFFSQLISPIVGILNLILLAITGGVLVSGLRLMVGNLKDLPGITDKISSIFSKDNILSKINNRDELKKSISSFFDDKKESLAIKKENFLANNAWGNYLGEKIMTDDFSKRKRKGMNAEDREYLNKRYGLGIDLDSNLYSDQKDRAIRQALDEQGKWDEAMLDLHNNKYMGDSIKRRVIGAYNNIKEEYGNPWKEYLGNKYDEKKADLKGSFWAMQEKAEWYRNGIDLDQDEGGASSLVKAYAKGLDIKEQIFGKASETNFGELLSNPKEFLSDPRNIEKMGKDIYSNYKDRYQKAKEDPGAQEEYDWYKEGGVLRFADLSRENQIRAIGDKLTNIKTGTFGMDENESIQEMLQNPERTMEVLKNGYQSIQENGFLESFGLDEDFGIEDSVKDKVSGLFDKVKEGFMEGIDEDDENQSLFQKAKKKLAGLLGWTKESDDSAEYDKDVLKEEMDWYKAGEIDFTDLTGLNKYKATDPHLERDVFGKNKREHYSSDYLQNDDEEEVAEIQKESRFMRAKRKMAGLLHRNKEAEEKSQEESELTPTEKSKGLLDTFKQIHNIDKDEMKEEVSQNKMAAKDVLSGRAFGNNTKYPKYYDPNWTWREGDPGATEEDFSVLDMVGGEDSLLSSDNLSKGSKSLSKIGKSLSSKGGKLGKVGKVASKLGGGVGKAGGKLMGKVGGKLAGKVGGKLAGKALAQVGSKVLGGALMATGIGAPLGLLLESPLGGFLMEGAMNLGGKALGAVGGAFKGVGKALFGHKRGGGGKGILGSMMAMSPIGMAAGLLGGIFGGKGPGNMGKMLGGGPLGLMKMVGPLGGMVGLLGSIFNINKKNTKFQESIDKHTGETLQSVRAQNSKQQVNAGSGGNITIQNININTQDDPEAIKAMFLELIIELQEQVNPRLVSRTAGQAPSASNSSSSTENEITDSAQESAANAANALNQQNNTQG